MPLYKEQVDRYSTAEYIVGQWINGSTLYEKTVEFGTLPNATTKNVAHGISSPSIIFLMNGYARSNAGTILPIPHFSPIAITYGIGISIDNTNISIFTAEDRSAYTGYITIRYTKA